MGLTAAAQIRLAKTAYAGGQISKSDYLKTRTQIRRGVQQRGEYVAAQQERGVEAGKLVDLGFTPERAAELSGKKLDMPIIRATEPKEKLIPETSPYNPSYIPENKLQSSKFTQPITEYKNTSGNIVGVGDPVSKMSYATPENTYYTQESLRRLESTRAKPILDFNIESERQSKDIKGTYANLDSNIKKSETKEDYLEWTTKFIKKTEDFRSDIYGSTLGFLKANPEGEIVPETAKWIGRIIPDMFLSAAPLAGSVVGSAQMFIYEPSKSWNTLYTQAPTKFLSSWNYTFSKEGLPQTIGFGITSAAIIGASEIPNIKLGTQYKTPEGSIFVRGKGLFENFGFEKSPTGNVVFGKYVGEAPVGSIAPQSIDINLPTSESTIYTLGVLQKSWTKTSSQVKLDIVQAEVNAESPFWSVRSELKNYIIPSAKSNIIGAKEGIKSNINILQEKIRSSEPLKFTKDLIDISKISIIAQKEQLKLESFQFMEKVKTDIFPYPKMVKEVYNEVKFNTGSLISEVGQKGKSIGNKILIPLNNLEMYRDVNANYNLGTWIGEKTSTGISKLKYKINPYFQSAKSNIQLDIFQAGLTMKIPPYVIGKNLNYLKGEYSLDIFQAKLATENPYYMRKESISKGLVPFKEDYFKLKGMVREGLREDFNLFKEELSTKKSAISYKISNLFLKKGIWNVKKTINIGRFNINLIEPYKSKLGIESYGSRLKTGGQLRNIAIRNVMKAPESDWRAKLEMRREKFAQQYKGDIKLEIQAQGKTVSIDLKTGKSSEFNPSSGNEIQSGKQVLITEQEKIINIPKQKEDLKPVFGRFVAFGSMMPPETKATTKFEYRRWGGLVPILKTKQESSNLFKLSTQQSNIQLQAIGKVNLQMPSFKSAQASISAQSIAQAQSISQVQGQSQTQKIRQRQITKQSFDATGFILAMSASEEKNYSKRKRKKNLLKNIKLSRVPNPSIKSIVGIKGWTSRVPLKSYNWKEARTGIISRPEVY